MNEIRIRKHEGVLLPESSRVIIRPSIPSSAQRVTTTIGRVLAMSEEEVRRELEAVFLEFDSRHLDLESQISRNYERVLPEIFTERSLSRERKILLGAYFSGEYAIESAALFNPSIVPHPDQGGLAEGELRFVMSLRATGEGHVSSIEFRTGLVRADGEVAMDPVSRFVKAGEVDPNPDYDKKAMAVKLHEMGFDNAYSSAVLEALAEGFTKNELNRSVLRLRRETLPAPPEFESTIRCIEWLADSNYEMRFSPKLAMNERVIFPVSANESNGIEDARFVRFVEADGSAMYYATYTAYNGRSIMPQFIETRDFLDFRVLTLSGKAVKNKGMALFPRRVDGSYAMLSRQDDENLSIMFSDSPHYWDESRVIMRPAETWESVKIGNCGSPIETEAGWLVLTHGVGPMRKYCIGAALLDLEDPTRVIGRLREPLLAPEGSGREGYVPNVVYSCGSLAHGRDLILPYAMSDKASAIVSVSLDDLLAALKSGGA
jgi:predicted GH43/DUF377 family glycosyl hydrolase